MFRFLRKRMMRKFDVFDFVEDAWTELKERRAKSRGVFGILNDVKKNIEDGIDSAIDEVKDFFKL